MSLPNISDGAVDHIRKLAQRRRAEYHMRRYFNVELLSNEH